MNRSPASEVQFGSTDLEAVMNRLRTAIRHRCPAWLREQEEDLIQTAMLRALRALSDPKRRVNTSYLNRIAYSVTIDEIRRRRADRSEALVDDVPDATSHPERQMMDRQVRAAVRECLERIAESRRHPVALWLEGHTARDVTRILGWNLKKSENLLYRGLADLRTCLDGKGVQT